MLLAWQAKHLDTSIPSGDWLPKSAESVQALHSLEQMDRTGIVYSMRVVIELPNDSVTQTDAGWDALNRVAKQIESDPRCDRVISIATIAEGTQANLTDLSRETRRTFLSSDGKAALVEILPKSSLTLRQQVDWVREIRKKGAPALTGVPDATMLVGGIPALNADYETIIDSHVDAGNGAGDWGDAVGAAVRLPIAVCRGEGDRLNLVSVAASFGALVLVFQDGHGSGLLGVPAAREAFSRWCRSLRSQSSSD